MIIVCPHCGTKNRVDESLATTRTPVCGKCKQELPISAADADDTKPIELTDSTFQSVLSKAGATPLLIDCWAPWCGPCRMIAPMIEQLAAESSGRWLIAKLNTDENPRIAGHYNIDAIPTMLIFKNGKLIDQLVGLQPKSAIEQRLLAAGR